MAIPFFKPESSKHIYFNPSSVPWSVHIYQRVDRTLSWWKCDIFFSTLSIILGTIRIRIRTDPAIPVPKYQTKHLLSLQLTNLASRTRGSNSRQLRNKGHHSVFSGLIPSQLRLDNSKSNSSASSNSLLVSFFPLIIRSSFFPLTYPVLSYVQNKRGHSKQKRAEMWLPPSCICFFQNSKVAKVGNVKVTLGKGWLPPTATTYSISPNYFILLFLPLPKFIISTIIIVQVFLLSVWWRSTSILLVILIKVAGSIIRIDVLSVFPPNMGQCLEALHTIPFTNHSASLLIDHTPSYSWGGKQDHLNSQIQYSSSAS